MAARRKSSVKLDAITGLIRSRVVASEWAPGSRIPPRSSLVDELSVSSATLQLAIDALVREGFIETFGAKGTRVAKRPPHLFHFGLVFPDQPERGLGRAGMVSKCIELIPEIQRTRSGLRLPIFFGGEGGEGSRGLHELEEAVETRSLAGLIFIEKPSRFRGTPILDRPGLPRVAVSSSTQPSMPVVGFDYRAWISELAELVAGAGCRRVAVLGAELLMAREDHRRFAMAEFADRGLHCGPHWWQSVSLNACASAGNIVRLLMHSSNRVERPDAIVIEDDHLLAPAVEALAALGVCVPEEVKLFAHCNLPRPEPASAAVTRLGFPVDRLLSMCLDSLDAQILGRSVPPFTSVPPVAFDDPSTPSPRPR